MCCDVECHQRVLRRQCLLKPQLLGMLPCLRALRYSAAALLQVTIVQSSPDALRGALLAAPCAVVYTPPSEHFSIVPLPAMAAECPVLACNSSGAQRACHTIQQDG